jgi:hypothetical protein
MTKQRKGRMKLSISQILLAMASKYKDDELKRIAVYVEDLEEQIAYFKDIGDVTFRYVKAYSRMRMALLILSGRTSLGDKITSLHLAQRFAEEALEYADEE